jgi:cytochrome b561
MHAAGGWSRAQRHLHWWTAGLVASGFTIAWIMVGVPLDALLLKFLLYQAHKTIGLTVLALTLARLVLRAARRRPTWTERLPDWQRRAATVMHVSLYALLLVTPVLGYLTAATAPAQVPTLFLLILRVPHVVSPDPLWFAVLRPVHRACAIALVLLACGHTLAAVHHHLRGRAVLVRMWRG